MRLLCWGMFVLGIAGAAAVVPVGNPARGLIAEVAATPAGTTASEQDLPSSGGPEILPAASVLLGVCILIYALLRRQRQV